MARLSEVIKPIEQPEGIRLSEVSGEKSRTFGATGVIPEVARKPIYEQISVEDYPKLGTFQDVAGQFGTAFFNQLAGQLPEAYLRKRGYELPEPVTGLGKAAEITGGIAGATLGVPGKAFGITTRLARALPRATRFALGGAAAGLAVTPKTEEGKILAPKERLIQASIGAGTGILTGLTANLARNIKNVRNPVRLAEKTRETLIKVKVRASEKFGKALDTLTKANPERKVSLRNEIDVILADMRESPRLKNIVNRIPQLKKLIDNPEFADNVTLKESQNILNSLRSKLSPAKLVGRNIRPDDLPLLDFIDDVRYQQLTAFPEMANVRAQYGEVLNRYNTIKPDIKIGNLLRAMVSRWREPEIQKRIEQLLPKEAIREIGGYRRAAQFIKTSAGLGKYALRVGIGGGIAYGLLRRGGGRR
jgi:hypothetical protein